MGVYWILGCKDCKKYVDLDKTHTMLDLWQQRDPPEDERKEYHYNAIKFMAKHWGHNVNLCSDFEESDYWKYRREFEEEWPYPT